MRKRTIKVTVRLTEQEHACLSCLQYHHHTWDPSKTLRFALKVLAQCSLESMTEEQRAKMITDYGARNLVEAVRVHDRIKVLKSDKAGPPDKSDNPPAKSRTMPASSGKKKRPAKAASG